MTFYKEHKIYSYPPRGSNGCIGPAYASCCYHKIVWIYGHELVDSLLYTHVCNIAPVMKLAAVECISNKQLKH
jgi:hypothetical protein